MRAVALLALAAGVVSAQDVQKYKSSLDMTVDPNSVDDRTRAGWCTAQSNTCNILCAKDSKVNDCEYMDLSYKCTCSSNNSAPGLQYYDQTMPTFICKALFSQCIEQHVSDADGQKACTTNINDLCGEINPNKADIGGDSDDDEDNGEDGDDEEKPSSTAATTAAPTATTGSEDVDKVTTTNSDGFAAPTGAPKGIAAMAALGLVAALV